MQVGSRTMQERQMIRSYNRLGIPCLAVLLSVILDVPANAQLIEPGRTALEASSGGAVRNRAPGNMVSVGVAAAFDAADAARAGIQISEAPPPTSIRSQALADCLDIVFGQLNTMLALLDNVLQARLGATISIPENISSGDEIRR